MVGSRQLITQVAAIISAEDFVEVTHQWIYTAVLACYETKSPVDPLFVAKHLAGQGLLEKVGGVLYLHQCVSEAPVIDFAIPYARQVAEFAGKRRISNVLIRSGQRAANPDLTVTELYDHTVQDLKTAVTKHTHSYGETAAQMWDNHVDWITSSDRGTTGLSTGIGALDDELGGLQPGRLILFAGRPGMGKSVIAVQAAMLAARRGHLAQLFSLEMTTREVFGRMLSSRCCIDQGRICRGGLSEAERKAITKIGDQIRGDAIVVDARTRTVAGIRAAAEKLANESNLTMVAVDYVQLVIASRRYDNRTTEVGEISSALKTLSVDLGITVLAACQLNRAAEARPNRVPALSDLRESGSLEQDADQVVMLHRPDYYDPKTRPGEMDFIIAKNRHGVSGTVVTASHQLHWSRVVDRF
jgi:replicative DNA helicase